MPDINTILFYIFAFLIVSFSFIVVFAKNIIYSAVSLFVTLFGTAALYILLRADFLAITQVMVYIGGILILLIFGIMMTTRITDSEIKTTNLSSVPAVFVSAGVFVILIIVLLTTKWNINPPVENDVTVNRIGNLLLTTYLLPFEIASVVLLIALMGAAMYARKK
ncbi:MAG: NADH-quinone oxidoreductase subunit J [Ignavibacteria bacterium]|nr:NADH-quinone oxidoreductase subunit J [Ignavibacteria bacterium]